MTTSRSSLSLPISTNPITHSGAQPTTMIPLTLTLTSLLHLLLFLAPTSLTTTAPPTQRRAVRPLSSRAYFPSLKPPPPLPLPSPAPRLTPPLPRGVSALQLPRRPRPRLGFANDVPAPLPLLHLIRRRLRLPAGRARPGPQRVPARVQHRAPVRPARRAGATRAPDL